MPLRGRVQWSLLATTLVSGVLAFVLAARGDIPPDDPEVVGSTTTTSTTTTTVYVAPIRYVVQRGDTLYSIAETFRVDMRALMDLNDIADPDRVEAGWELVMPPATGFVPIAPSTTMKP